MVRLLCTGTLERTTVALELVGVVSAVDGDGGEAARARATEEVDARLTGLGFVREGETWVAEGDESIDFLAGSAYDLPEEWEVLLPGHLASVAETGPALDLRVRTDADGSGRFLVRTRVVITDAGQEVDRPEGGWVRPDGASRSLVPLATRGESPEPVLVLEHTSPGLPSPGLDGGPATGELDFTGESSGTSSPKAVLYGCVPESSVDRVVALERAAEAAMAPAALGDGVYPSTQVGRISRLMGAGARESSGNARAVLAEIPKLGAPELPILPSIVQATLRPYQVSGISWLRFLYESGVGGVLADDMGTGKTLHSICLLSHILVDKGSLRAIVVAPTSVVPNWVREFRKFSPSIVVHAWEGSKRFDHERKMRAAHVVVTSYALLRRDEALWQRTEWDAAVLDEAQLIKNATSSTATAARRLRSSLRLALTGTPYENDMSDVWSIFEFAVPGLLGGIDTYDRLYGKGVRAGDEQTTKRLVKVIQPFFLRRMKSDVVQDMPPLVEIDRVVPMTEVQAEVYSRLKAHYRQRAAAANGSDASAVYLEAIVKLRLCACDARLLGVNSVKGLEEADSGKLEALRDLLQEAVEGGHKVLVFSNFASMLRLAARMCEGIGLLYEYIDGDTKDRQARVDRFQTDPSVSVFFLTLQTGGTGINLQAADVVIVYDPWWNPAREDQGIARAYRIGQGKQVTAYRLVAADTIDEKVLALKAKKRVTAASLLEGAPGSSSNLSLAEMRALIE